MARSGSLLACLLVAVHLAACATSPPPVPVVSEAIRSRMGRVGVATFSGTAKGELMVGIRGRGAAATVGAAKGALAGFLAPVGVPCSGDFCGAVVLLIPMFVVVGATVGGIIGAIHAVPDDKAAQIEAELNTVLADVGKQEALQSRVIEVAARSNVSGVKAIAVESSANVGEALDYRNASGLDVDTVLEVGLVQVGLIGRGGEDPELALRAHAVARLVDVRTNAELYRNDAFTHYAPARKYSEWTADNALLLKRELQRAYELFGTSIVDEVFLVFRSKWD